MKDGFYKIKTWNEMEREFGLNGNGNICCEKKFTREMENIVKKCKNRTIVVEGCRWKDFIITEDMIEKEIKNKKENNEEMKNEIMDKYSFRGNFNLEMLINDMIRDNKRSFIVMGKENAIVGILQNTFNEFENIAWDVSIDENGNFYSCEDEDLDYHIIHPYFFLIIDKYEVHNFIELLKEERRNYNKTILKEKDKIIKLRKQNKLGKDKFKVFCIEN